MASPETNETLVSIPQFGVEHAEASLANRSARVKLVRSTGGSLVVRREADGTVNLLKMIQAPMTQPASSGTNSLAGPAPPSTRAPAPWTVNLDEVAFQDFKFHVEDKVPVGAPPVLVDQVALNVRGLSTVTNTPITAAASLRVNESGTANIQARGRLQPATAEADITVTNLDLRLAQPYLQEQVKLQLSRGAFAMQGKAVWQPDEPSAARLLFQGDLGISGLHAADLVALNEFVSWTNLEVRGINFTMQPERLQIQAIDFDGFKTSILVNTNRQINLASIFPPSTNVAARSELVVSNAAAVAAAPSAAAPKTPFPISLGKFTLRSAGFHFVDASIQPNCRFDIQELGGTITNISSDPGAVADVDISGRFDEQSPFTLAGKVSPLSDDLALDLTFSNRNLQLPAFTPYMEKYGGYPLNKGRLSVAVAYAVKNHELKAENKFVLDQFMLGGRNESPDATKLPVKLAIALLKDRNGKIDPEVPLTGRLDDPQFKIGPIIGKVILNLIAKAATSPFKLLGSLVGGGEELSFVEFEPGTTQFLSGETNKFEKLIKALEQRPAINIEIEASVDPDLDRQALARQMVRAQLKTERLQELSKAGQAPPAAETFQVEPADLERLLRGALAKQFGTNLTQALKDFAAATTNAAAHAAEQAKRQLAERPKPGLLRRAVAWIPIHSKKSPAGQARQRARADAALLQQNPELATLQVDDMEILLASKVEVPLEVFRNLMEKRAQAVQAELLRGGTVAGERVFLTAPKVQPGTAGSARAILSLN